MRNLHASDARRRIAEGVMRLARSIGVTVIANSAENFGERAALTALGIRHFADSPANPLPLDYLARRAPRSNVPQHRRLAHHRAAAAAVASRVAQQLATAF